MQTLEEKIQRLVNENAVLERLSTTDSLTGLHNRRFFEEQLEHEVRVAERNNLRLSVALFDIDFFKGINSRYGHTGGDAVLKQLGACLGNECRAQDWVARVGGEEFALILPNTDKTGAVELLNRLRTTISSIQFSASETETDTSETLTITFSAGVVEYCMGESAYDFYERADGALCGAKSTGRNKVVS